MDRKERACKKKPCAKSVEPNKKVEEPKKATPIRRKRGAGEAGSSGLKIVKENSVGDFKHSLLEGLRRSRIGDNVSCNMSKIRKAVLVNQISRFNVLKAVCPFYRRVTSFAWHPTDPNIVVAASKGGEIAWYNLRSKEKLDLPGIGPGGSILGMKMDRDNPHVIYVASLEGSVKWIDLEKKVDSILLVANQVGQQDEWFTSLDFCLDRKLILSGDSSGYVYVSKPNERINKAFQSRKRLHKSKVTHVEICPRDPNVVVTASIDHTVKLWDFRMLRESSSSPRLVVPLHVLPHKKGVNSAYFNPSDRFSLLTTDQHSDIRIYRSPVWNDELIIKHPHRQFQHLTPIKAAWHPLEDLFIVGRYPDDSIEKNDERTLDIYDGKSGQRLHKIPTPTQGISSLNMFNITGDAFISCTGSSVMIWKDENMIPMFK